jgi:hypothetical protein
MASSSTRRLLSIIGMLGSDQPGEVVNAAKLAGAILKGMGLTWGDLVDKANLDGERVQPSSYAQEYAKAQAAAAQANREEMQKHAAQRKAAEQERMAEYLRQQKQQTADFLRGWEQNQGGVANNPYARPKPSRQANYSERSAKKHGIRLWDLIRYAMSRIDELDSWETSFVRTLHNFGPNVAATEAQWRSAMAISRKLNVRKQA